MASGRSTDVWSILIDLPVGTGKTDGLIRDAVRPQRIREPQPDSRIQRHLAGAARGRGCGDREPHITRLRHSALDNPHR